MWAQCFNEWLNKRSFYVCGAIRFFGDMAVLISVNPYVARS